MPVLRLLDDKTPLPGTWLNWRCILADPVFLKPCRHVSLTGLMFFVLIWHKTADSSASSQKFLRVIGGVVSLAIRLSLSQIKAFSIPIIDGLLVIRVSSFMLLVYRLYPHFKIVPLAFFGAKYHSESHFDECFKHRDLLWVYGCWWWGSGQDIPKYGTLA